MSAHEPPERQVANNLVLTWLADAIRPKATSNLCRGRENSQNYSIVSHIIIFGLGLGPENKENSAIVK